MSDYADEYFSRKVKEIEHLKEGDMLTTRHGNKFKKFSDGWSPLEGGHWDRWTTYTNRQLVEAFGTLERWEWR